MLIRITVDDLPECLREGEWKAQGEDPVKPEHLARMLNELRRGPRKYLGTRHNDVRKKLLKREGLVEYVKGGEWSLTDRGRALFEVG